MGNTKDFKGSELKVDDVVVVSEAFGKLSKGVVLGFVNKTNSRNKKVEGSLMALIETVYKKKVKGETKTYKLVSTYPSRAIVKLGI